MDRLKKGYSFVHVSGKLISKRKQGISYIFVSADFHFKISLRKKTRYLKKMDIFFSNEAQTVIISCEEKSDFVNMI